MERQSRGWGFESPVVPFNFWMLTEFVLICLTKPDVCKTLYIPITLETANILTRTRPKWIFLADTDILNFIC